MVALWQLAALSKLILQGVPLQVGHFESFICKLFVVWRIGIQLSSGVHTLVVVWDVYAALPGPGGCSRIGDDL